MEETLTRAVMAYKDSGEGWGELLDRISLFVYRYPGRWTDWDEDRCSDFFLLFYPKIPGLVRRYQPRYRFETYLSNSLEWAIKTYLEMQAGREHYESWAAEVSEEPALKKIGSPGPGQISFSSSEEKALLESPEKCPFELEKGGRLKDPALRRRILYAVLLRAADLDDHRIPVIAALVDVDSDWLFDRTRAARNLVSGKIERREKLRSRRNEYWYQLDGAQKRLENACDSHRRCVWERKTRDWKRRYTSVSRGIRSMNIAPTHKDIGRLLNTPPGTVSSGLYLLRKKWHEMECWTRDGTSG